MTGQEFWARAPGLWRKEVFVAEFDDAIAQAKLAERERCVKVVRDNLGKCVSDAACEALVEEIWTP